MMAKKGEARSCARTNYDTKSSLYLHRKPHSQLDDIEAQAGDYRYYSVWMWMDCNIRTARK